MKNIPNIEQKDLQSLEAWRGILSVLVFYGHVFQLLWVPLLGTDSFIIKISGIISHISVLCFFCLSGFVIFRSLSLNKSKNNGNIDVKDYVLSRFSRIYPVFLFSFFLVFVLRFIFFHFDLLGGKRSFLLSNDFEFSRTHFDFTLTEVWDNIKMTGQYIGEVNGPLWTLTIEWWLYFLALFLFYIFTKQKIGYKIISLVFIINIINKLYLLGVINYLIIWFLSGFYYLLYNYRYRIQNYLVNISIIVILYNYVFVYNNFSLERFCQISFIQFFLSILFIGIMFRVNFYSKLTSFLAKFSYSLYVLHFPILLFIFSLTHEFVKKNIFLNIIVSILSTILIFTFSFYVSKYLETKHKFLLFMKKIF